MNKLLMRLCVILSALSSIAFFIIYPSLPPFVPLNYDTRGLITSWGPKHTYIWLQLLPLAVSLGFMLLPRVDPRRKSYSQHRKAYHVITLVTTLMLLCFNWVMLLRALGFSFFIGSPVLLIIGVVMVVFGNYMPQLRPNYFMGIRTPWALADPFVWRKTHRFGGVAFCLSGILMVITALLPDIRAMHILSVAFVLLATLATTIYSYLVYRKQGPKEEDTDA